MAARIPTSVQRAREMFTPPEGRPWTKPELIRVLKRYRKIEEARLRILHRAGGGGVEISEKRAAMVDAALTSLWNIVAAMPEFAAMKKKPVSLVATGGFGRQQMNASSDVDMLFLISGNAARPPEVVGAMTSCFLTILYDGAIRVGDRSVRSVGDSIRQANEDNQVKTALIEARLVVGDEAPFAELKARFDKECMDGKEAEFFRLRQADLVERHKKQGDTPFMQEPNVKTGCGGLRDYHNLLWIAYAKLRTTSLRELLKRGVLTSTSCRELSQAYDFLMRVRTEMHYIEKREHDVLTLRLQGVVATNLGYRSKKMLGRIETFMRDYYTHTRNVLQRGNEIMDLFHLETVELEQKGILRGYLARKRAGRPEKFDGFISRNERLYAEHDRIFKEDPPRLMRMFVHTQQRHLRLSPELFQLVQKSFAFINQTFRYSKSVRESFEAILSQKGDVSRVLRQMHRVGFLGRWMPEFGALTNLVQHEFFHRYTADEHTLRTIDKLDEFAGAPRAGAEFYQKLFREMQEPFILYLALLLHDSGRAANSREHSDASAEFASRVSRRLQITGERRRLLMFLVDHHLTLYRWATTKNLDDPKVIEEFARIMRNRPCLDALMVMSCADSLGTSEHSWTAWKESLMRHLYDNTSVFLDNPSDFTRRITAPLLHLQTEVLGLLDDSYLAETVAHFNQMPRGYFNFREARAVAGHLRLFREFFRKLAEDKAAEGLLPTLEWEQHPEQGCSNLTVVSWDRHLLLARVAGALASQNINILSADLYQRADDLVLDIFRVCTPNFAPVTNERTQARVRNLVGEAFQSTQFDFSAAIAANRAQNKQPDDVLAELPQRAYLNNDLSAEHTVVELQALDRIGLLYDVFMTIGELGLSVTHARINTEKGVALDTIYLQDRAGGKVMDRGLLHTLRENLDRAVFS